MQKLIIIIILNFIIGYKLFGQGNPHPSPSTINVRGIPTFNNPVATITEAGENYNNLVTESSSNTLIDVDDKSKPKDWQVWVRISQSIEPLTLYVIRTDGGTSKKNGKLTGGNINWTILSTIDTHFFTGNKDWNNIPVKFRIGGISVVDDAGIKSFNVVFTVVDQ